MDGLDESRRPVGKNGDTLASPGIKVKLGRIAVECCEYLGWGDWRFCKHRDVDTVLDHESLQYFQSVLLVHVPEEEREHVGGVILRADELWWQVFSVNVLIPPTRLPARPRRVSIFSGFTSAAVQ